MKDWYKLDVKEVLLQLGSDASYGLTKLEASYRLKNNGANELVEGELKNPGKILWGQLASVLVLILLAAIGISVFFGDYYNAIGIFAIVILIVVFGFSQEYRAQKAIANLKKLAIPSVKVFRSGCTEEISARDLVIGDVVFLETEDIVPADCRVLSSVGMRIQESTLTGVSEPVDKDSQLIDTNTTYLPLSERQNMVYMGTFVTDGQGKVVVTETGMNTELGHLAKTIKAVKPEPTGLQKRLDKFNTFAKIKRAFCSRVMFTRLQLKYPQEAHAKYISTTGMLTTTYNKNNFETVE